MVQRLRRCHGPTDPRKATPDDENTIRVRHTVIGPNFKVHENTVHAPENLVERNMQGRILGIVQTRRRTKKK